MHVVSACVRCMRCWSDRDGTRTRARLHARALCTRTARGTLPPVPRPAFDLESAEARALEHALLSNVLGCVTCKCTLFSFQLPVYKLSPTSLSAFDRTDITDNTTTASRTGRRGSRRLWRRDDEGDGRRRRDERRTSPRL